MWPRRSVCLSTQVCCLSHLPPCDASPPSVLHLSTCLYCELSAVSVQTNDNLNCFTMQWIWILNPRMGFWIPGSRPNSSNWIHWDSETIQGLESPATWFLHQKSYKISNPFRSSNNSMPMKASLSFHCIQLYWYLRKTDHVNRLICRICCCNIILYYIIWQLQKEIQ